MGTRTLNFCDRCKKGIDGKQCVLYAFPPRDSAKSYQLCLSCSKDIISAGFDLIGKLRKEENFPAVKFDNVFSFLLEFLSESFFVPVLLEFFGRRVNYYVSYALTDHVNDCEEDSSKMDSIKKLELWKSKEEEEKVA